MASHRKPGLLDRLKGLIKPRAALPPEIRRAQELIAAIDAGGIPLNPARINDIARNLGLDVSRRAPMEETVRRIRAALERGQGKAGRRYP